ncbi:helix-turn-helix transcriptional regulator [Streptomyces sp. N2-109]|uniref:Helix-turn-helix transcriptional regulator n=1 Tax=Streptomyces gossypii TaxID=2883101 RepID=A0ABT2JSA0_9ACTN|nr:helix-turn-helix transcriptional regulator [Streptomyces gossypii]MCT2590766.1 helix-turn-helix transcriptional regulator [Streptomyces gossypii]
MRARSGPTVAHRVLATRLRVLREGAGLTLGQAAGALGSHPATVRRIERAETGLDAGQVQLLLARYRVTQAETERILTSLAEANLPGWWHRYREVMDAAQQEWIGTESSASVVRVWHPALIPDLLQTPAYAAAVQLLRHPGRPPGHRDLAVELLQQRQARLAERSAPLWVLIPEAALHTEVGGVTVMREQLASLRSAAARPGCTVQVSPLAAPPHALTGTPPLSVLRLPAPEIGDLAVLEIAPGRTEVSDDPVGVGRCRVALDTACAAVPHPDTPLPVP